MSCWRELEKLLDDGDEPAVAGLLAGLAEPDRTALAGPLAGYARELTGRLGRWGSAAAWDRHRAQARGLTVAVVGCAPTAKAAAAVLGRSGVRDALPQDARWVLAAAADRGVPWLGDLGRALAAKFRRGTWYQPGLDLVCALVAAGGGPWPTGDGFVRGWAFERLLNRPAGTDPVAGLEADPALDDVLPRLFEVGLEGQLGGPRTRGLDALVTLVDRGRLDRTTMLVRCLDRLSTARRPGELAPFLHIHERLAPTEAEVGTHAVAYAGLLAGGHGRVAAMAQQRLRAAETAGAVGPDVILDVTPGVLLRTEKALVRHQISWLDALARRHGDRVDDVLAAVAAGSDHPEPEMRDRVAAVIGRHRVHNSAGAADDCAAGAGDDCAATAASRPVEPVADTLPVPRTGPFPDPVADPDELAAELTLLVESLDPVRFERVLDGLVRLSAADRPGLVAGLKPLLGRYFAATSGWYFGSTAFARTLAHAVYLFAGTAPPGSPPRGYDQRESFARSPSPERLVLDRVAGLDPAGQPFLVATPTSDNGLLDPGTLLERLRRAAADGWEPATADLIQALWRLPRHAVEELAGRCGDLSTPAGRRLARWVDTGGHPDADVLRRRPAGSAEPDSGTEPDSGHRDRVILRPPPPGPDRAGLYRVRPVGRYDVPVAVTWPLWPAVAPAHRELVAAHLLPGLEAATHAGYRESTGVLVGLAHTTGPLGVASLTALSFGLAAHGVADRLAAVDALLLTAAAGDLDAGGLGAETGRLVAGRVVKLNRIVESLTGVVRGGAPRLGWSVLRELLPPLLAAPKPPAATADAVSLAAQAVDAAAQAVASAQAVGADREPVPGLADVLAEVAARKGSSRLVTEARRLRTALSSVAGEPIGVTR